MCPQPAQFFVPECISPPGVSFIPSLSLFKAPSLLSCLFPFHSQVPNSFTSYLQFKRVSKVRQSFMPVLVIFCASEREKFEGHCAFLKLYSEPLSLAITYHCQLTAMINGESDVYTIQYYTAVKMRHQHMLASTWITLKNSVEPESQLWKNKYGMMTFVKSSQTGKIKLHVHKFCTD